MDQETKQMVEAAVLGILRESVSLRRVRAAAAERLGIDLSAPDRKRFVRGVFEGYLRSSLPSEEEEDEDDEETEAEKRDAAGSEGKKGQPEEKRGEEQEGKGGGGGKRERDDAGDLFLCRVSSSSTLGGPSPGDQQEGDAVGVPRQEAGVDPRILLEGRQGTTYRQRNKLGSRAVGSISGCCAGNRGCHQQAWRIRVKSQFISCKAHRGLYEGHTWLNRAFTYLM